MKGIALFVIPIMLSLPSIADAHPRSAPTAEKQSKRHRRPPAYAPITAEPLARIRANQDGQGLTPLAFATWLKAHPRLAAQQGATLHRASSRTSLLNRASPLFAGADRDGDGRISAVELADFIQPFQRTASISSTA